MSQLESSECVRVYNWERNTGDKNLKFRQEHNINIGKTSLTKRNIAA